MDQVWNAFWTGGISNPLTVIEQFSYLLFIKRLDDLHSTALRKASRTGKAPENPVFGPNQEGLRWSVFTKSDNAEMFEVVRDKVFPMIKKLDGDQNTAYAKHMRDAVFLVPKPSLLRQVVDLIASIPMDDKDTKGDLYEYLLSKLTTAGVSGQFRTPRHIIKMMVALMQPSPKDSVCDPACGTAGFLMAVTEYLAEYHPDKVNDPQWLAHYHNEMFHGYDFDASMMRIGSMNMMLHGVNNPNLECRDTLSALFSEEDKYSLILANPPFKGKLDEKDIHPSLTLTVKTKSTELLFLALFLRLLESGGACACIVPDGVLFGSSNAHTALRKLLVEEHQLDGIISMPSGVFKPYAGVSTAIMIFTKGGVTRDVWFYDMQADGYSLDDKRTELDQQQHETNNIPDLVSRWHQREQQASGKRTEQSFLVPKEEIAANGYDLSINRYKQTVYEEQDYETPQVIIQRVEELQREIDTGLARLKEMLL